MLSYRDREWKLLLNPDRSRAELYDIPRDPTELSNSAKTNPDVVERLAARVLAWQKELSRRPVDRGAGKNEYRLLERSPAAAESK